MPMDYSTVDLSGGALDMYSLVLFDFGGRVSTIILSFSKSSDLLLTKPFILPQDFLCRDSHYLS